jgi:sulfur transfer complex TusBCD TusB component (DsrH family)
MVILMKRTIILAVVFLTLGTICGNFLYQKAPNSISVFQQDSSYYFLQEGVYTSKDVMQESIKDIPHKLVVFKDDMYYVYVGITKSEKNADKIQKIYEELGYQIHITTESLDNEEFSSNVTQFDLLVEEAESSEDVLTVEEVILANYEELIGTGM